MGLQRVRLNWCDCKCWWRSRATEIIINVYQDTKWCIVFGKCDFVVSHGEGQRRPRHPTPGLLLGKSHGRRSLVGCSPWDRKESDMTEWLHFHFHALEKEMATHSNVLAQRIPGTGEPGGLPSMGSHRVGHDWSDLAAAVAAADDWIHIKFKTQAKLNHCV